MFADLYNNYFLTCQLDKLCEILLVGSHNASPDNETHQLYFLLVPIQYRLVETGWTSLNLEPCYGLTNHINTVIIVPIISKYTWDLKKFLVIIIKSIKIKLKWHPKNLKWRYIHITNTSACIRQRFLIRFLLREPLIIWYILCCGNIIFSWLGHLPLKIFYRHVKLWVCTVRVMTETSQ